jgi:muramoyltetrapeptide carboxypeptidase
MIQPPNLQPGDTIGIVCPAGAIPAEKVQNCIETLTKWGYQVRLGATVGAKKDCFSGTDAQRASDLQSMLDDPGVHAILCGRGGYGVSRMIDQINFTQFKAHPKWVIGFSDITVLHAALQKQNYMSIHGPMAAAFSKGVHGEVFTDSLKALLEGRSIDVEAKPHPLNELGKVTAPLVGGNLCLIAHLIGSRNAFETKGKLLFIEDVGEYHYNLDRMMIQIKNAGLLEGLAGLIVGGFTDMKDPSTDFGATAYEIIAHHTASYAYPKCFGFPISHDINNFAVKEGGIYTLDVQSNIVCLLQS